jgi:hypothetical protein
MSEQRTPPWKHSQYLHHPHATRASTLGNMRAVCLGIHAMLGRPASTLHRMQACRRRPHSPITAKPRRRATMQQRSSLLQAVRALAVAPFLVAPAFPAAASKTQLGLLNLAHKGLRVAQKGMQPHKDLAVCRPDPQQPRSGRQGKPEPSNPVARAHRTSRLPLQQPPLPLQHQPQPCPSPPWDPAARCARALTGPAQRGRAGCSSRRTRTTCSTAQPQSSRSTASGTCSSCSDRSG